MAAHVAAGMVFNFRALRGATASASSSSIKVFLTTIFVATVRSAVGKLNCTDFKGDCVAKYGDPDAIDCVGDEKAAGPKDATYAEPDAAGCVGAQSPGSRDAKYGEPDAIDCVGVGNE